MNVSSIPANVVWRPQAGSQCMFLNCPIFEALYEGTRGNGKTDSLLMDYAKDVGKGYGAAWRGILFRKTYKQLADVVAKSKKWFPRIFGPAAKWNQGDYYWHWPTGEMLLFRHWMRDDDYENYHGHEYSWLGLEELCNWATPTILTKMTSTVRCSDVVLGQSIPMRIRATTNPYGPGHGWVKKRYNLSLPVRDRKVMRNLVDKDGKPMPDRVAIHGDIRENKILLAADPHYIEKLNASCKSEAERKAWIYGSWDIVAGGMFDDLWKTEVHNLLAFDIPKSWAIKPAMDWGTAHPFSLGWWAVSDGTDARLRTGNIRSTVRGDIFRIREWYGADPEEVNVGLKLDAITVARGMMQRQVDWGIHKWVTEGVADGAIKSHTNGASVQEDFAKEIRLDNGMTYPGIRWKLSDKSSGTRKLGWQACRQRFMNSYPGKNGRPREYPGIFIFGQYCPMWIDKVLALPRDPDDMEDVDSESEDHNGDETRYFVYEQPHDIGITSHFGL